tara:strand:- start:5833 stop:6762 length:930 start_codon:yes stop_codon:yes gene_type:complete
LSRFYSNGKLLLTGEYLVLDSATALAVPTKFGQDLLVNKIKEPQLIWKSFTHTKDCWFEVVFDLPKLRLVSTTFDSEIEGNEELIAETLQDILKEARILNPDFLNSVTGFMVNTNLTFPRNWGLGTSSTLVNNIAQWASVDAYQLLWNSFSGSGYDIANAQHNTPILYEVKNQKSVVKKVEFMPSFSDQLFFIHLNKKQDSKDGIARFKEKREKINNEIQLVSEISRQLIQEQKLSEFEKLIHEHEKIISSIIELPTVKERLFPDYFGTLKSLGAWGGDFILATGNNKTPQYFKTKGYTTILRYSDMVL